MLGKNALLSEYVKGNDLLFHSCGQGVCVCVCVCVCVWKLS